MTLAIGALLVLLAYALRIPYRGIALENNGGYFLLGCRDRARGRKLRTHPWAPLTMAVLCPLFRLFGARREYRWIRGLGVVAHMFTVAALWWGGSSIGRSGWGIAAAVLYLSVSSLPHLIVWFTCPEWFGAPFAVLGNVLLVVAVITGPGAWFAAAGVCLLVPAGFKLSGATVWLAGLAGAWLGNPTEGWQAAGWYALSLGVVVPWAACRPSRGGISDLVGMLRYKCGDAAYRGGDTPTGQVRLAVRGARGVVPGLAPLGAGLAAYAWTLPGGATRLDLLLGLWWAAAFAELALQCVWYPGHWVPLVAPTAFLGGLGVERLISEGGVLSWVVVGSLFVFGLTVSIHSARHHPWRPSESRRTQEVFARLAAQVRERTAPDEPVFVWGWHPQILLLADRESVVPELTFCDDTYLDQYTPDWRRKVFDAFARTPPKTIVVLSRGFPFRGLRAALGLDYEPLNDALFTLASRMHPRLTEGLTIERAIEVLRPTAQAALAQGNREAASGIAEGILDLAPGDADAQQILAACRLS